MPTSIGNSPRRGGVNGRARWVAKIDAVMVDAKERIVGKRAVVSCDVKVNNIYRYACINNRTLFAVRNIECRYIFVPLCKSIINEISNFSP